MRPECEKCQHYNIGFNQCETNREEFDVDVRFMASRLNLKCMGFESREIKQSKMFDKPYHRFSKIRTRAGIPETTVKMAVVENEKHKGVRPFVSFDGTYKCPCGGNHKRGPVNGARSYRCLKCGKVMEVQPIDDFREHDYPNASGVGEKKAAETQSEPERTIVPPLQSSE